MARVSDISLGLELKIHLVISLCLELELGCGEKGDAYVRSYDYGEV